jgi:hypothetical protein
MLIGLFSTGGSPGVSTAAIAMGSVWPSPVVVVDADPSGGDILAAAGSVVEADREHNLLELMRLGRQGQIPQVLDSQITMLPTGAPVVAGLAHPGQAGGVAWTDLAEGLRVVTHRDVLVDLGRWGVPYAPAPVLRACDLLLLVVRTHLRGLRRAERILPLIREDLDRHNPGAGSVGLLVVNDHGPYAVADIVRSTKLGVPVFAELPLDTRTAAVFSEGAAPARHLDRSPLARALPGVVRTVGQLAQQQRALGSRAPMLRQQPTIPTPVPRQAVPVAAPGVPLREMLRTTRRLSAVPPTPEDS